MKKQIIIAAIGALFVLTLSLPSSAARKRPRRHGPPQTTPPKPRAPPRPAAWTTPRIWGTLIHESTVEGYHLAYHLIDMQQHTAGMKDMPMTHHLMVFVQGPDRKSRHRGQGRIPGGQPGRDRPAADDHGHERRASERTSI